MGGSDSIPRDSTNMPENWISTPIELVDISETPELVEEMPKLKKYFSEKPVEK